MQLFPDIQEIVTKLLAGLRHALVGNLVGLYLRGSLATGEFDPDTSDLDLLVATERPVSESEFAALTALHDQLAALPNPYANRMEVAYIDRRALKRYEPGLRHPTLYQGETLAWQEHHSNWVLERWVVRHHGVALLGPQPQDLIDPIAPDDLRAAVSARLQDWADWASDANDPDWSMPLQHKAYVVETMCRALHTLASGELASKRDATEWARRELPARWSSLVKRSRSWHGKDTPSAEVVEEVREFVRWTFSKGTD